MSALVDTAAVDLRTLYCRHHGWLYKWLRQRLGNASEAADLAHDTYVRIMASGRTPRDEQSRAYLMQVAKGLVIDLARRRRIEQAYRESLSNLPEPPVLCLETQAIVVEALVQIDAILSNLPPKVREVFVLSQFEGLTYSEIAIRLKMSVGGIRKYMAKAAQACLLAMC